MKSGSRMLESGTSGSTRGRGINEAEPAFRHHSSTEWQTGNVYSTEEIPAYSPRAAVNADF